MLSERSLFRTLVLVLLISVLSRAVPAQAATPQEVDDAIAKGKEYLYSIQQKNGTWEGIMAMPDPRSAENGGVTAMAVYALLTCGESETNPKLLPAIHYLLHADIPGTYAEGFQALALSKLKQTAEVKTTVKKVYTLLHMGGTRPLTEGLYRYMFNSGALEWDSSCSQYGVLGVWACGECGIEVPDEFWSIVDKAWRKNQMPDGGWGYGNPEASWNKSSQPMTAAGIASLFITQDGLAANVAPNCKGNVFDPAIEAGLKWIEPHMSEAKDNYTWYGICRIGMASGYKYLGDVDWYKAGAEVLVKAQQADGSWRDTYGVAPGTTYAMLFLARGRAPVVMNKLEYAADAVEVKAGDPKSANGHWDERPRDAAGVAVWLGEQLETYLNWQIVNLSVDVDELHDAPILYLAGDAPLKFSKADEDKLRQFIEDGGMILGNADCATEAFSQSFRELGNRLCNGKYEFRNLPADHPIFTREQFLLSKWKSKPVLMGLSNGVRELMILIPQADPSRAWQSQASHSKRESFELAADIFLYAVDKQHLQNKGVTYIVRSSPDIATNATIKLARLEYAGNWDPEPGGWRRQIAVMHNENNVDLVVEPVKLGKGDLTGYAIAHLTGTTSFKLTDEERAQLKKFVENGGLLFIDAAGGSSDFAESAKKELATIFGADAAAQLDSPLPMDDPMLGSGDGVLHKFGYRDMARKILGISTSLRLRGIKFHDRLGVAFSREDISGGLVGEEIDGIVGYSPETATALTSKIILAAGKAPAATQPAVATQPAAAASRPAAAASQPAQ